MKCKEEKAFDFSLCIKIEKYATNLIFFKITFGHKCETYIVRYLTHVLGP